MGGYKAGEIASAIAVTSTYKNIVEGLQNLSPGDKPRDGANSREAAVLKSAIIDVNSEIYKTAQKDPQCQGMGTTIVVVLFHDNICTIAHIGDSRLYRKRQNTFTQVTKDHSLIQELIDRGLYSPEEAVKHTPKNLVTRAVGIELDVQVDINEESVYPGDIYMLCSDGLNDMVDDEEIHLTLSKYSANLAQGASELVRLANLKGGKDNISVILVRILDDFSSPRDGLVQKLKRRFF
jgi:protein phosphatase